MAYPSCKKKLYIYERSFFCIMGDSFMALYLHSHKFETLLKKVRAGIPLMTTPYLDNKFFTNRRTSQTSSFRISHSPIIKTPSSCPPFHCFSDPSPVSWRRALFVGPISSRTRTYSNLDYLTTKNLTTVKKYEDNIVNQPRSLVPVEDSDPCSSKGSSKEDFRVLFYCKI